MQNKIDGIIPKKITKEQCINTGMAIVLMLLLFYLFLNNKYILISLISILIINMIIPIIFKPLAFIWFSLSNTLGLIMSKILLILIYIILVVPIAVIFKIFRRDILSINKNKQKIKSSFKIRNHMFKKEDIEFPY